MKVLNIQVVRGKNSSVGNPSFIIKRWDNNNLVNELLETKDFKEFSNKKDGKGIKTSPNASYCYALLNKEGVIVNGVLIKATLFNK